MQGRLSTLNLDGSLDDLLFRFIGTLFSCTIAGACLEELRNGDIESA